MEATPEQNAEGLAIVQVLAAVLDRLVCANQAIAAADPGQVTKFHAMKAPGIGVMQYLERIHKYASCSNECFILALIYIDRLIQRNNFLLTDLNVHRVVITAVLLAAKFFDDAYYNNAYYAKVGGVLVSEMNGLEVDFLFRINFSLHVTPEVFDKYRAELMMHSANSSPIIAMMPPLNQPSLIEQQLSPMHPPQLVSPAAAAAVAQQLQAVSVTQQLQAAVCAAAALPTTTAAAAAPPPLPCPVVPTAVANAGLAAVNLQQHMQQQQQHTSDAALGIAAAVSQITPSPPPEAARMVDHQHHHPAAVAPATAGPSHYGTTELVQNTFAAPTATTLADYFAAPAAAVAAANNAGCDGGFLQQMQRSNSMPVKVAPAAPPPAPAAYYAPPVVQQQQPRCSNPTSSFSAPPLVSAGPSFQATHHLTTPFPVEDFVVIDNQIFPLQGTAAAAATAAALVQQHHHSVGGFVMPPPRGPSSVVPGVGPAYDQLSRDAHRLLLAGQMLTGGAGV